MFTAEEFAYEEFSGRGGRTCPTCQGTGRISKSKICISSSCITLTDIKTNLDVYILHVL